MASQEKDGRFCRLEVVGLALTLMVANVLQLVGIVVILASLFGDR